MCLVQRDFFPLRESCPTRVCQLTRHFIPFGESGGPKAVRHLPHSIATDEV